MKKKRNRRKTMLIVLAVVALLFAWFAGPVIWGVAQIWRNQDNHYDFIDHYDDEVPEPPDLGWDSGVGDPNFKPDPDRVNILLIGVDSAPGRSRAPLSDTIMLFSINKKTGDTVLMSIPRDTYVQIPGRKMDKINHSHAFGGAALLRQSVESFLDVPVDYYLRVNFEGFKGIVDMMGGVEIYVDRDMPNRKLKKGTQVLTGEQALWFVRDRNDPRGDFARAERQQRFLIAIAKQAQSQPFTRFSPLIREGAKYIDTDMPILTLINFGQEFWDEDPDKTVRYVIPGSGIMNNGVYYMQPDVNATREFLNTHMRVPR